MAAAGQRDCRLQPNNTQHLTHTHTLQTQTHVACHIREIRTKSWNPASPLYLPLSICPSLRLLKMWAHTHTHTHTHTHNNQPADAQSTHLLLNELLCSVFIVLKNPRIVLAFHPLKTQYKICSFWKGRVMGALRVFIHVAPWESSQEHVGGNTLQCTAELISWIYYSCSWRRCCSLLDSYRVNTADQQDTHTQTHTHSHTDSLSHFTPTHTSTSLYPPSCPFFHLVPPALNGRRRGC